MKNRYYEEQKNQWKGAVRLIWNDGKLRGTHAKLMIGSRSFLLQGYMEILGWIQWTWSINFSQRYIQEKSCFVVGSNHYWIQDNQETEAVNEEQRLNKLRYSKTYFRLEIDHFSNTDEDTRYQRKSDFWKLLGDIKMPYRQTEDQHESKWQPPLISKIGHKYIQTWRFSDWQDIQMSRQIIRRQQCDIGLLLNNNKK